MVPKSRIEMRSRSRFCRIRWMPETVICPGVISETSAACGFGRSSMSCLTEAKVSSSAMFSFTSSVKCVVSTVAASTTV